MNHTHVFGLGDFVFTSGEKLNNIQIECHTLGTPKYNNSGNITNAILYCHGALGSSSEVFLYEKLFETDSCFDLNKYFIIAPTAIGFSPSTSPSNSGLGVHFPVLNFDTVIDIYYYLLRTKFSIDKLEGVFGISMGGCCVLNIASRYPDFMNFIVPIATAGTVDEKISSMFNFAINLITKDPYYNNGYYTQKPEEGLKECINFTMLWLCGYDYTQYKNIDHYKLPPSLMPFYNYLLDSSDANDLIWRFKLLNSFDISPSLNHITANTLLVGFNNDSIFGNDHHVKPLLNKIPNSKHVSMDTAYSHVGITELYKVNKDIKDFICQKVAI